MNISVADDTKLWNIFEKVIEQTYRRWIDDRNLATVPGLSLNTIPFN